MLYNKEIWASFIKSVYAKIQAKVYIYKSCLKWKSA